MATSIAKGGTGLATYVGPSCCIYSPNDWYMQPFGGPPSFYGTNSGTPDTWHALPDGTVTVPSTASVGNYRISIVNNNANSGAVAIYDFEVVDGETRYRCTDGYCESFVGTPDQGYDSCFEAGCSPPGECPDALISTVYTPSAGQKIVSISSGDSSISTYSCVKTSGDGFITQGTFYGTYSSFKIEIPQGGTITVLVTQNQAGCAPVTQSFTFTNPGRYICSGSACSFDPAAMSPTGFASMDECLDSCLGGSDCALAANLTYERVSGIQFRVTANISGATGTAAVVFSTSAGTLANATANTALVNVADGATLAVSASITDGECTISRSVTVDGSNEDGEAACALNVSLALLDKGAALYTTLASATGNGGVVTYQFFVDTVLTSADVGNPDRLSLTVPYGETKTVIVIANDGTCSNAEALTITNADAGGALPDPLPSGDCIASLGIYSRDIEANASNPDAVIWNSRLGLEVRPPCPNPGCEYWWQLFHSSDASLFEDYSDESLAAHFPVVWGTGAKQTASGDRIERYQILASALSRPATQHSHMRIRATPVYQKVALPLDGDAVKIRDFGARTMFVFSTGDAKAYKWTAPDEGEFGTGTVEVIADLTTMDAGDATDAAILGDKLYVVAPGEVFAIDLTSGESTLNSGIRGETRATRFIEVVGTKPILIYTDNAATPKTRAYDLSFPSPKLVWESAYLVTKTQVADGKLLLAAGAALYVSLGGTAAPTLDNTFGSSINALAQNYVGLSDNHIWKKKSTGWASVETLVGPVGAVWPWLGGADAERALAGAYSGTDANKLRSELPTLNWADDVVLTGATGIRSMRSMQIEVTPATENEPAVIAEWMLIGDDNENLWVYSRSPLGEKDGAFKACATAIPRLFPLLRRKDN